MTPAQLKYTKDHEWITDDKKCASVGVTKYAIEQLGDIVHLDLPQVGTEYTSGDSFGTIESTKTVSDLYMPVSGKVVEVNKSLLGKLESLAENPYEGWLVRIELTNPTELSSLMDAKSYESFVAQ